VKHLLQSANVLRKRKRNGGKKSGMKVTRPNPLTQALHVIAASGHRKLQKRG